MPARRILRPWAFGAARGWRPGSDGRDQGEARGVGRGDRSGVGGAAAALSGAARPVPAVRPAGRARPAACPDRHARSGRDLHLRLRGLHARADGARAAQPVGRGARLLRAALPLSIADGAGSLAGRPAGASPLEPAFLLRPDQRLGQQAPRLMDLRY